MAVTGHRTLKEVTRYTVAADQERLAREAIAAIGPKSERPVANPSERVANSGPKPLNRKAQ